jgi:hypothetical protein
VTRLAPSLAAVLGLLSGPSHPVTPSVFIRFDEARPVVTAMGERLPAGLAGLVDDRLAAAWPPWVRDRDRAVRERLGRGEEDAVVNLLLLGTTFTTAPRLTGEVLATAAGEAEAVLARRLDDLAAALASPGGDERVRLARSVLARSAKAGAPTNRDAARAWLVDGVARVRRERTSFDAELARIRAIPDATEQLAERSTLFRERGIALDTSLRPAFAVEEALRDALERGLLTGGGVRRVAVVGPGLDFVDKTEGQDFYPPQCLQAVALVDSLVRLGLAHPDGVDVTAFDISPRVLDHLARARARAVAGEGYVLQLPRPRSGWREPFVAYWERFGDAVATSAEAVRPPPSAGALEVRAVRIQPKTQASVRPTDLNVVYQRLDLPATQRFDLVVATNILVYYDTFEQCLALANIARMTGTGGLFLSNNAVLELPGSALRSVGYKTVVFSDKPDDGEHVVFYRRLPDPPGR